MAVGVSWGRYPRVAQEVVVPNWRDDPLDAGSGTILPYGNGRSYGDSCLNGDGRLLHTRQLDHYLAFDPLTGILRCESGVLFDEILTRFVPWGWFLPVSPGTRFITVGGAIANDVHGKNHYVAGSFGHHVRAFELLRSDGQRLVCTPERNSEWFAATIGGLGLTGLVTWVEFGLRRIDSPWMSVQTCKFRDLDGFFRYSMESASEFEYTVAWIDCVARGKALGRGLFSRGNHVPAPDRRRLPAPPKQMTVPFTPPISTVNSLTLRMFNSLYFNRHGRSSPARISHYEPFFYPLDRIANWNRLYGPRGFLQYQCVVPPANAPETIAELLRRIATSGTGSFLAVLKQFGSQPSRGMLSFPRPGTTLALDFPIDSKGRAFDLLVRLDEIVGAAGGAVYPAKDARMSGIHFRRYFPTWEKFQSYIDPRFSSSFWRRVMGA